MRRDSIRRARQQAAAAAVTDVELRQHARAGAPQERFQLRRFLQERKATLLLLEAGLVGREMPMLRRMSTLPMLLQRFRPTHTEVRSRTRARQVPLLLLVLLLGAAVVCCRVDATIRVGGSLHSEQKARSMSDTASSHKRSARPWPGHRLHGDDPAATSMQL
jgi:hypothetical protein